MTKFTAVVPMEWMITPPHESFIENLPPQILILAHDVLDKKYSDADVSLALKNYEGDVILDNSASEKVPLTFTQLLDAVNKIGNMRGVELAIPDALQDGAQTVELAVAFSQYFETHADAFGMTSLMFIPQGSNDADFLFCMKYIANIAAIRQQIATIGIPRNICPRIFSTREYAAALATMLFPDQYIHLLGFTDNIQDDIQLTLHGDIDIRSIDSAVPLRASSKNIALSTDPAMFSHGCNFAGSRGDWFENPKLYSSIVMHNIDVAKEVFKEKA